MPELLALLAPPDLAALPPITDERMQYAVTMAAMAVESLEPSDRSELAWIIIAAKERGVYSPGLQSALES